MLARLEYYPGIMFLTTNLSNQMDEAIASRIDINLRYPVLDFQTRRKIWSNFLFDPPKPPQGFERPKIGISADDLDKLARWKLNGRDIKQSVKIAMKWCYIKGLSVNIDALKTGLRVTAPDAKVEESADMEQSGLRKRKRRDSTESAQSYCTPRG